MSDHTVKISISKLLTTYLFKRFDKPCVHDDFHPIILDKRSEITGSFHVGNKVSLQAHFILEETDTVPDGLYCYPAQNKARTEKTEPCISKPEKEALPEPNCEMGVFLFSGDKSAFHHPD